MTDLVVDSSVVAKWVLPEVDTLLAQRVFAETQADGGRLVALDIALVEVANAISTQHKRGLARVDEARHFLSQLLACPLHVIGSNALLIDAVELAMRYRIAVYDAVFVALVDTLGAPGVTADERLYRAVSSDFPLVRRLADW